MFSLIKLQIKQARCLLQYHCEQPPPVVRQALDSMLAVMFEGELGEALGLCSVVPPFCMKSREVTRESSTIRQASTRRCNDVSYTVSTDLFVPTSELCLINDKEYPSIVVGYVIESER